MQDRNDIPAYWVYDQKGSTEVERKISQFILLNCTKWGTFRVQVHDLGHLSHPQAALNRSSSLARLLR